MVARPPASASARTVTAPDITLQINVCAGDLAYADATVGQLVATHRSDVREVLIVADACRPQSTPLVHRASRFPAEPFAPRVAALRSMCARWLAAGIVDRVEWIEPGAPATPVLNRRYLGHSTPWTHDHLGHALVAYFAGWESPRTRYVAHFDADILLHQSPGYSWLRAGVEALEGDAGALAASPRLAPPADGRGSPLVDTRIPGNGWQAAWPLAPCASGWSSPWFSTRAHLLDRARLAACLPLSPARGRCADVVSAALNHLLHPLYERRPWTIDPNVRTRPWTGRVANHLARRVIPPFPLPPEVLLHETALRRGLRCLYLADPRAWYLHPDDKPPALVALLPRIAAAVAAGVVPPLQFGFTNVRAGDWQSFVSG